MSKYTANATSGFLRDPEGQKMAMLSPPESAVTLAALLNAQEARIESLERREDGVDRLEAAILCAGSAMQENDCNTLNRV